MRWTHKHTRTHTLDLLSEIKMPFRSPGHSRLHQKPFSFDIITLYCNKLGVRGRRVRLLSAHRAVRPSGLHVHLSVLSLKVCLSVRLRVCPLKVLGHPVRVCHDSLKLTVGGGRRGSEEFRYAEGGKCS